MSTQNWESVTWDWLEREIVNCLLAADSRKKPGSLARLLRKRHDSHFNSPTSARKQAQERNNG
jgi:hypothetical protein